MTLRSRVLKWHDQSARDLPWRLERDPYRIWVSEIMLQQTRAETVIPYYHAFLADFPTVRDLAEAPMDRVLKKWEGLGYYSRARNLQKGAQMIIHQLGGLFPDTVKGLRALPGIGEYTAGAIASIAFGLEEPAIDGNQVRVLTRLFDVRTLTTLKTTRALLDRHARALIDPDRPGDFNQALMGLGALLCVPRKPDCAHCPVSEGCLAFKAGDQSQLPVLPEKTGQRVQQIAIALVLSKGRVYVRQRSDGGLLGGLWEFPGFEGARTDRAVREALLELGISVKNHRMGARAQHVFTHLIWHMTGHIYEADECAPERGGFVDAQALHALAMPTALKVFREEAARLLTT